MSDMQAQIKKRNRQMALTIVVIVVVAIVIFGGGAYLFTRAFTGHIRTVDDLETMTIEATTYSSEYEASGDLEAASSIVVSPEVDGTVTKVMVKDGDHVEAGDVLFTMKNASLTKAAETALTTYQSAGATAESANEKLTAAKATLDSAKAKYQKAKDKLAEKEDELAEKQAEDPEYDEDLSAYEDAVDLAKDSVTTAKTAKNAAKETYNSAKESRDTAQSAYNDAQEQVDKLTVTAESAGTVSNLNVKKGVAAATINAQGGALEIADMDTIVAVVQVPEANISSLTVGNSASMACASLSADKTYSATISAIADTPSSKAKSDDDNTTYYDVTLELSGLGKKAKVGMLVTVTLTLENYGTVYYVPTSALATNNNGAYVEVVESDASTKDVLVYEIDTADDGRVIVQSSSLHDGDLVVTNLS